MLPPETDPVQSASSAGLRDLHDDRLGIRRIRIGKGFRYRDAENRPVRNPKTLRRIRAVVIPSAWTKVWICPTPDEAAIPALLQQRLPLVPELKKLRGL
jgi:DNA topoisomerase-1